MFKRNKLFSALVVGLLLLVVMGVFLGFSAFSIHSAGAAGVQPTATSSQLARVVAIAKAIQSGHAEPGWKGGFVPYSWGGGHSGKPGPSLGTCVGYTGSIHPCPANHTVGTDCSGFVRWVYDLAFKKDVLGSGSTNNQIRHLHRVSASAARPGDLVFYGTLSNTHHVGIYIGHGLMINALETGTHIQTNHLLSDLVGYFRY